MILFLPGHALACLSTMKARLRAGRKADRATTCYFEAIFAIFILWSWSTACRCTSNRPDAVSADAGPHEALDELPLEQQEADQEWTGRHQGRGADDRPVDALVRGGEHLQADREGPGLDRVG